MVNEDIIQKNEAIQNQLVDSYIDKLTDKFEKDLNAFHKFVNKLNLNERLVINTFSQEKERIEIAAYIDILKQHFRAGFARQVALKAIHLCEDMCDWSAEKLSPILTEYSHKLDETNQLLVLKNDKLQTENEQLHHQLQALQTKIKDATELETDFQLLVKFTESLIEKHNKVLSGEELSAEEDRIYNILFDHNIIEEEPDENEEQHDETDKTATTTQEKTTQKVKKKIPGPKNKGLGL